MKKVIVIVLLFVSVCSYSQTIYKGTVSYAYQDMGSQSVRYKKELSIVNGEYITKYILFNSDGKCYSTISVIHNRKEKKITISAQPPNINIYSDGVYKYELTYTDDLGLALTIEDVLLNTMGDGIKNKVTVKFYSSKREHLKLIEIIEGETKVGDPMDRYHYYLDK